MTPERLAEISILSAREETAWEGEGCPNCGMTMHLEPDHEPIGLCDGCRQKLADAVPELLAEIHDHEQGRLSMLSALQGIAAERDTWLQTWQQLHAAVSKTRAVYRGGPAPVSVQALLDKDEQLTIDAAPLCEALQSIAAERDVALAEIARLKLRPPMGCFTCEHHNDQLVERIERMAEAVCETCAGSAAFVAAQVWPLPEREYTEEERADPLAIEATEIK